MKKQSGYTLIELMIIVAALALIVVIVIPYLLAARLAANEVSAISTLRNLASCQDQFKVGGHADLDGDGIGEFGMFRELSGSASIRKAADGTGGLTTLNPPSLSGAFRVMNANHEVPRSGYYFKVFLPGASGAAVSEKEGASAFSGAVDTSLAEKTWCCYAWPVSYGNSGSRTFFVNQTGYVTCTELSTYTGTGAFTGENAGRAFRAGGALTSITGTHALGTRGRDGVTWKQVN